MILTLNWCYSPIYRFATGGGGDVKVVFDIRLWILHIYYNTFLLLDTVTVTEDMSDEILAPTPRLCKYDLNKAYFDQHHCHQRSVGQLYHIHNPY